MRATCENCGQLVDGEYCGRCGQSTATIDRPALALAKDLASEALALDSRIRRTLWPLIARPGRVAREYVEGHRARFVPPVRLYLLTSFFMFVVLSFGEFEVSSVEVGGREVTVDSIATRDATNPVADSSGAVAETGGTGQNPSDSSGTSGRATPEGRLMLDLGAEELNERLAVGVQRLLADPAAFNDVFIDRMTKVMFVLLPAFAGLLKLLWRRRLYVHHIVFAIYFHSFVFLLVGFAGLPEAVGLNRLAALLDLLVLTIPIYLVLALKTFYQSGWPRTVLSAAVVSTTYGVIGIAAIMTLLVWSVLAL